MVSLDYRILLGQISKSFLLIICLFYSNHSLAQNAPAYKIEKLPTNINSPYEEIKPMSSENGDTLFFIRAGFPENKGGMHAEEDIWFTSLSIDESWQNPSNKLGKINNAGANIFAGLSSKSTTIYLFDYSNIGKKRFIGISTYVINSGYAKEIIDHEHAIEIDNDFHDLYLHPNEKVLLISMRSMNTLGLEDIYISTKDNNETWRRPINLGPVINSRGFEISPFLSDDGTVLYFSSNGHGGFGDADIYASYRLDESWTNWSKPKNMGQPFNSSKFDAYLSKSKKGDFFISSNRSGKFSDIYKINIFNIDSLTQNVTVNDPESSYTQKVASSTSELLPETLVIFFDFDKFELSPKELHKLNMFISENLRNSIDYQISVLGYTDDTGTENYNHKLSLKRAKTITKIMRKAGVNKNLIEAEGKGVYPISVYQTLSSDKMRRVEISLSVFE